MGPGRPRLAEEAENAGVKPYDPATDGNYFEWRSRAIAYQNHLDWQAECRRKRDRWRQVGLATLYVFTVAVFFFLMWIFP